MCSIDVFKSNLGGYEQDQLEVLSILEKYGLKSLFAFNVEKGRSVPIRFHPRNDRSVLSFVLQDGAVIYIDGEPQIIKPLWDKIMERLHEPMLIFYNWEALTSWLLSRSPSLPQTLKRIPIQATVY